MSSDLKCLETLENSQHTPPQTSCDVWTVSSDSDEEEVVESWPTASQTELKNSKPSKRHASLESMVDGTTVKKDPTPYLSKRNSLSYYHLHKEPILVERKRKRNRALPGYDLQLVDSRGQLLPRKIPLFFKRCK